MSLKCPNCGYDNEDAAVCCNLCQQVLRKEKPAAPPAPALGEPKALDSLDALKALLAAARAALDRADKGEVSRLMGRLFLETDFSSLREIVLAAGELWLTTTALDPVRTATSRAEIGVAAEAVSQEDFPKAFVFVKQVLDKAPAVPGQDLTLALLAVGLQAAVSEERQGAESKALIDQGLKLVAMEGKRAEGLALLEKARTLIADPPRSAREKGARERLDALISSYRGASPDRPPSGVGEWQRKAKEAVQRGDMAGALDCFERLTRLEPKDAESWGHRGVCLHQLGRFEEALACYQEAAELAPGDASAWLNQSLCHQELKRGAEALACCEKALALTPLAPNAWYTKGSILLELLGRHDEASACFDEVLGLKPDFFWALYKKALARDQAGRRPEALAAFERFLGAAPPQMEAQIEAARRRADELRKTG
jgi:tetratricopeptide (TPR) repeat protein